MSKKEGPALLASHKPQEDMEPWNIALDKAIRRRFPDILPITRKTRKGWETVIERIDGKRVMPRQRRALEMYVRGWMDNEESYS